MALNLRAYWQRENTFGVVDRIEIHQEGFLGSVLQLEAGQTPFTFSHRESQTGDVALSVQVNKIIKGVLDFYPRIESTELLLQDIADSPTLNFKAVFKRDGVIMWQGFPNTRVIKTSERDSYIGHVQFTDFDVLKTIPFPLEDNREKVIRTLGRLLYTLGFTQNIVTQTSWQEQNTTITDDFLNQIYHDTYGLRNYGRNGDEADTVISVYEAIERCATPCLLIMQWNGFRINQISAFADPANVLQSTYTFDGSSQVSSSTVDIRQTGYKSETQGLPSIKATQDARSFSGIHSAKVSFNHRLQTFGISIPSLVELRDDQPETGRIDSNTASNELTTDWVGTDLSTLNEGDLIHIEDGGELKLLGEIDSNFGASLAYFKENSNFTTNDVEFWLNQDRNITFTQSIATDGTQSLQFFLKAFFTGVVGGNTYFAQYRLKVGTHHWDASTNTWSVSEIINKVQFNATTKFATTTIETDLIPTGVEGEIELTLFHTINDSDDFVSNGFTEYQDCTLSVLERSVSSNESIFEYTLEQGVQLTETLDLGVDFFGDSIVQYSPAFYRHGTGETDLTDGWRRRGQTTYVPFHQLKLKEVLDFQRTRTERKPVNAYGEIDPIKVLVYDAKNYAYVGGTYNGRWNLVYVEIREQTATDTFNEQKLSNASGESGLPTGGSSSGGVNGGITEADADAKYFQIANDLSEGDAGTIRTNIGVIVGVDVQSHSDVLDDISLLDESDGNFIVGDGSNFTVKSGSDARDSLGLGTADSPTFSGATIKGDLTITKVIYHSGDSNTFMKFNPDEFIVKAGGHTIFNYDEDGTSTFGIDVEGRADISIHSGAFFFGGSEGSYDGNFGINTITPETDLDVNGDAIVRGEATFKDNVIVEGGLFASEFVIDQTRVFFNFRMAPSGGKIARVVSSTLGLEQVEFQDENGTPFAPFAVNDIVRIKQRTGVGGVIVKNIMRKVLSISSNIVSFTTSGITWSTIDQDVGTIAVGDHVVGEGNTTDATRDHYIDFDISGDNGPAIRIINGADDVGAGTEVVTVGNMNDLYGQTSEVYGFGAGDSTKVGSHIFFTENDSGIKMESFLFQDSNQRLIVNSDGTTYPDVVINDSITGQSTTFTTSSNFLETDAGPSEIVRFKTNITVSFSSTFATATTMRVEGRLDGTTTWQDLDSNDLEFITIAEALMTVLAGALSLSNTSDDTKVEVTVSGSGHSTYGATITLYLRVSPTTRYDGFRLVLNETSSATTASASSASGKSYSSATELNPIALWQRIADTLIVSNGTVFQDASLLES